VENKRSGAAKVAKIASTRLANTPNQGKRAPRRHSSRGFLSLEKGTARVFHILISLSAISALESPREFTAAVAEPVTKKSLTSLVESLTSVDASEWILDLINQGNDHTTQERPVLIMLIRRNAVEVWHISDFPSQPLDRICLFVCLFVAIKPEKVFFASCVGRKVNPRGVITGFWFFICYAATQLATTLHQRRIQVVRSNKVAQKRLTESNGTPAMDFGCEKIRKRRCTQTKNRTKHTNTIVI